MDKRIVASCALGILFAYGSHVICAQDESGADTESRISRERTRRAVEAREEVPGVGIGSGLVVAYGHPLHQPYQFEYRGNVLFVNGIQIEPSLVLQRDNEKNRPVLSDDDRKSGDELTTMENSVRKHYSEQKGKIPDAELRAEILATVRANPRVKDAEWKNDKAVAYHPRGRFENNLHVIPFSQQKRPANPNAKTPEQLKQDNVSRLEKELKQGGCLVWGTIGAWHGPDWKCKNLKLSVRQIMDQPTLSDSGKEEKLRELFGGDKEDALDVMANYSANEWK